MPRRPTPAVERVLARSVAGPGGCIICTLATNEHGYPKVEEAGRTLRAARVVYEAQVGPVPDGLEIDHRCRVRRCVNYRHLEAVTHSENELRKQAGFCRRGHRFDARLRSGPRAGKNICTICAAARQRRFDRKAA